MILGIVLYEGVRAQLLKQLPTLPDSWKTYAHHITLHFRPSKELIEKYQSYLSIDTVLVPGKKKGSWDAKRGPEIKLQASHVVYDNHGMAVKVTLPDGLKQVCQYSIPHITIATDKKPLYSRQILENEQNANVVPINWEMRGVIMLFHPHALNTGQQLLKDPEEEVQSQPDSAKQQVAAPQSTAQGDQSQNIYAAANDIEIDSDEL